MECGELFVMPIGPRTTCALLLSGQTWSEKPHDYKVLSGRIPWDRDRLGWGLMVQFLVDSQPTGDWRKKTSYKADHGAVVQT